MYDWIELAVKFYLGNMKNVREVCNMHIHIEGKRVPWWRIIEREIGETSACKVRHFQWGTFLILKLVVIITVDIMFAFLKRWCEYLWTCNDSTLCWDLGLFIKNITLLFEEPAMNWFIHLDGRNQWGKVSSILLFKLFLWEKRLSYSSIIN